MGVRNPFRIEVDPETSSVSWGDYGPDAGAPTPTAARWATSSGRRPRIDQPAQRRLAVLHGPTQFNYNEWNFATATPGPCVRLRGRPDQQLAAGTPACASCRRPPRRRCYYGDNADAPAVAPSSTDFSAGTAARPRWAARSTTTTRRTRRRRSSRRTGTTRRSSRSSRRTTSRRFDVHVAQRPGRRDRGLPAQRRPADRRPARPDNPMDMEFGPDGSLYVLEYGDGFFRARTPTPACTGSTTSQGNKAPQARVLGRPDLEQPAPLTVDVRRVGLRRPRGRRADLRVGLRR